MARNKIVPIKDDWDFLELPKSAIDLQNTTVLFSGDEPRFSGNEASFVSAHNFCGQWESELFDTEAINKVYTDTWNQFGTGELWTRQVGGTPHCSLSVLGHLSRESIHQAGLDLKEPITFSFRAFCVSVVLRDFSPSVRCRSSPATSGRFLIVVSLNMN
jgi:hypothetical protein